MHIHWATLAEIAVVAAATALTVVLLVAFAVVGWSADSAAGADGPEFGRAPVMNRAAGRAVAILCMVAAGLIVCCGLYLIIA